jgi:predicted amidohydrolase
MAVTWLDTEANLAKMAELIDRIASRGGADIVVFPECASAGYIKRPGAPDYEAFGVAYRRSAQKIPGPFTEGLGEIARKHGCYIVSGMTEAHPTVVGTIYNSAVLVDPDGKVRGVHRKAHPGGFENAYFYRGNTLEVYPTELGQLSMMICADYIHPETARVLTLMGAEILCVPYAYFRNIYPEMAIYQYVNATRAFENGIFVIAANRVGKEDETEFVGRSCITDPFGRFLAQSETEEEDVVLATLCREDLETARARFSRFLARRPELYGKLTEPL